MFHAAVTRLTLWYLLLIMLLSVMFSAILYRSYHNQVTQDLHRQENLLRRNPVLQLQPSVQQYTAAREAQLRESEHDVLLALIYFNILILVTGGLASYLLARRTLRSIQKALEAQQLFAADASHELRTPLTAIRTEVEVALRDPKLSLKESKDLHRSTLEEITKLEQLATGLLKLAQQDSKPNLSFEVLPAQELITEAIKRLAPTAKQAEVTINNQAQQGTAYGERWSLVELITILLDNAIKYSAKGGEVVIRTAIVHHGQTLAISIQDSGCGITATDLPHIFDRFYRAERSRSKKAVSGYGLGLSIAKNLAELHRGSIEVKTQIDNGTVFTILLPLKAPPQFTRWI